jgi:hypothetical protein
MIGQVEQKNRTGFKDTEVENTKKDLGNFSLYMYGTHRLNMELNLQSLFGLHVMRCPHLVLIG